MIRIFAKAIRKMRKEQPELVGNTTQQRNWRGIIIALVVIVAVLGLIVTAIVLVTPKTEDVKPGKKLNFKDFMQGVYEPKLFQPVWGEGETFVFRNDDGAVIEFDCPENDTSVVMDNSSFREFDTSQYKISPDKAYVLLAYHISYQYRHSQTSRFKIYNIASKTSFDLVGKRGPVFQYVTWSDRQSLICVQGNNIYYIKDIHSDIFLDITTDGQESQIYNGVPDWLYEEEILHSDNSIWQSPDSRYIVYASISDIDVFKYDMTVYGYSKYVKNKRLPYPKPGTPNPTVVLKVFDLRTNDTTDIRPPQSFAHVDHYLTGVTFKDSSNFLVTWLNRPQNVSILAICDAFTGDCPYNFEAMADGGWIDIQGPHLFTPSGNNFFVILPQKDGAAGNFKHVAIVDATTGYSDGHSHKEASKLFLTAGKMDVQRIVGFNFEKEEVYFTAIKQDDPRERHLYSATILKDAANFRQPTCLSCDISDDCLFVDARFSRNGKYYILECKGPGVPTYTLKSVPDTTIRILEDNQQLKEFLSARALPKIEFLKIPIENDQHIWAKLLLPPILKKEEILTYNLLVKVYGAPNTQHVTHEFEMGWETYLSSEHDLIIGFVDGRGSSGRGDNWLHSNYKSLGKQETEDTLTAAKYFKDLPYVNERTAIWGLSHGGFLTLSVLANRNNVFSCGMSVAPVTDWRYYDSFYTERYMGEPTAEDNLDAYNNANISRYASNFKKSKFLLIHGTGDDNVHFQNSAQLIKALTEKDVYFRTQIYTDQQHLLNGGNTRTHLYNTMENFLYQCYGKTSQRQAETVDVSEKDDEVEE